MTQLNPAAGAVMAADKWVTAMRIRLGSSLAACEQVCAACGHAVLDLQAKHALCCASGESTAGHYRVRKALLVPLPAADPSTACEVEELISSAPTLRLADILTAAAHPSYTAAVDVMVKAPHAAGAGHDCTEAGKRQKLNDYGPWLHELEAQGIRYVPAVFSSYGRRHPDVTKILKEAARRVARRRGLARTDELLR